MDKVYACLLTIILEIIIILFYRKKLPLKKVIIVSIFINIVTNSTLNLILGFIDNLIVYTLILIILEFIVLFIEGLLYSYIISNKKLAYLLSLLCNLFSFVIGSVILNVLLMN